MKKNSMTYLSKPKISIPIAALVIAIIGIWLYMYIGRAPVIPTSLQSEQSTQAPLSGSTVSLSFAQSGRLARVTVAEGTIVQKGQVLATLSAPQAEGAVTQAKGALQLAQAQYASLNAQYKTTKEQQDTLVQNAYNTLLSSNLEGVGDMQDPNIPIISGTYTCNKEGSYILKPYTSGDGDSGYSVKVTGLENATFGVKYNNSVPMGTCGLQVKFARVNNFNPFITWTVAIPNTKSTSYVTNKNAYDLAVQTRDKVLADLATTIGQNGATDSVAKAQITAAEGAYESALGAYENTIITSPVTGVVTFVDSNLKVGQSVAANKSVISINVK